jgi:23S rRNA U2552 (ribose-2'-O)-methylase RlmE/FtsJ
LYRAPRGELALDISERVLKRHGYALIKVILGTAPRNLSRPPGPDSPEVKLQKPVAYRARSAEMYLLARDFFLV